MRVHVPTVPNRLSWGKNLYLPNVGVPAAVLILDDRDLHEHGFDVGLQDLARGALLLELEGEPADRLLKIDQLHFLELVE